MKRILFLLITIISVFSFTIYSKALETSKLISGSEFNQKVKTYSNGKELNLFPTKVPYLIFGKYDDYKDNCDDSWDDGLSVSEDDNTKLFSGTYNDEVAIYVLTTKDVIVFNEDSSNMFDYNKNGILEKTKEIIFNDIDTSSVTNMSGMFIDLHGLTKLDLTSFNTENVTDMSNMFEDCYNMTEIDLSSFDTKNVTNMKWMFYNCKTLEELDLSNFNTSKVTDMNNMFSLCSSLTSLDVSNFDTSKVTSFQSMFSNCKNLASLDLSSFHTISAIDNETNHSMWGMFSSCESLTSLDLHTFDTSNVMDMAGMFRNCKSLTKLDLSSFNTSKVENMNNMFLGCSSLTSLDLHTFDTSNVLYMKWMFQDNINLKKIYVSENGFNTSKVDNTNSVNMFKDSTNLLGEKGTTYNSDYLNKTYARIDDAPDNPGYFTKYVPITVSFVPNNDETIPDVIIPKGDFVTPPEVTKEEYVLGYWSENEELDTAFNFDNPIVDSITLYAKWYLQYDWNDDKTFEIEDIFAYRKYLAGIDEYVTYYNGLDDYRKKALNSDDNTNLDVIDLVRARIALANK